MMRVLNAFVTDVGTQGTAGSGWVLVVLGTGTYCARDCCGVLGLEPVVLELILRLDILR